MKQERKLFCQKNRTMENIPPTQQALLQHTKRAVYQAGIGQPVTRHNNRHQLLKAAVGHWMQKQSPGFLSGARSLRQQGCK
ncbi:hypothetical protein GWK47_010975 [Chionoecetes opilio]|uniref:Uncharacterized protein n=1 Tax=Chionoecetes opilio TaxID=41210 RepID=A0A8J5CNS3_CHIOP|nr:hypothetical protein GWK47_010975 [Chionoecetes opilio]